MLNKTIQDSPELEVYDAIIARKEKEKDLDHARLYHAVIIYSQHCYQNGITKHQCDFEHSFQCSEGTVLADALGYIATVAGGSVDFSGDEPKIIMGEVTTHRS